MKTSRREWKWYRGRLWLALVGLLLVVLVEFGMVLCFGMGCGLGGTDLSPAGQVQGLGDWLASR